VYLKVENLEVVLTQLFKHREMIKLKSDEEIELMRQSNLFLGKVHAEVAKRLKPGIKTIELDRVAEEYILSNGGIPSFKNYRGYPATLCISVNDTVIHGIPGDYVIKEGDIVSIDCGVLLNGFHSDSAFTYAVGEVPSEVWDLMLRTLEALYKGIEQARELKKAGVPVIHFYTMGRSDNILKIAREVF